MKGKRRNSGLPVSKPAGSARGLSLFTLLMLLFCTATFANENLPVNEDGKIHFREEVQVEGLSRDELRMNKMQYAATLTVDSRRKSAPPILERDKLIKEGSFFVYTNGLFTPQIHGEISFKIKLEINDNSYTYTFTDFVFQHYQKNRYGHYVPVKGKYKKLEDKKYAGMQDTWEQHKLLTKKVVESHIRELKAKMEEV